MTVSSFSGRGKQQLLSFSADAKGAGKPPTGKQADGPQRERSPRS